MTSDDVPNDDRLEPPTFEPPTPDEPAVPDESASLFDDFVFVQPVDPLTIESSPTASTNDQDDTRPDPVAGWSEPAPDAITATPTDIAPEATGPEVKPARPGPIDTPVTPSAFAPPQPLRTPPPRPTTLTAPTPDSPPATEAAVQPPPPPPSPSPSPSPQRAPAAFDPPTIPAPPEVITVDGSTMTGPPEAEITYPFDPPVPSVPSSDRPPAFPPDESAAGDGERTAGATATSPPADRFPVEELPPALDELLDADRSIVIVLDRDGTVRTINDVALRLLGAVSASDMVRGSASYSLLRSLLDHVPRHLLDSTDYGTWQGDFDHTDAAGQPHVFRATVAVRPEDDEHGYVAVIAHEVTEIRAETARLRHSATHDSLTGLANRRQVLTILEHAIDLQRGRPGHVAALFVDLDRLKYVNDALGHAIGDQLLMSTGARLAEAVRPNDHVARIGGDEFLVACAEMPDAATALELSERIRQALTGRLRIRDLDIEFSVSIGVALSDPETLDRSNEDAASDLISNADTAMYEAKNTGRGRSVLFTAEMRSAARERSELAAALAHAVAKNELTIEYQPVFSAVTREASATEALVRWNHPERGWIDPSTFVAVAEESGSIGRLGEFVLRTCLGDLRRWIDEGRVGGDFAVHVNVSQVQLASTSFVGQVQSILRDIDVQPSQLVLEARESALVSGNTDVQRSVRTLRRLGVGIAIDNFGTGANALSVLTDVGADFLKLDGSLALPSGSSDADIRLVRALVLLAHALDMHVVAEKVSGAEQLAHLQVAGCDYVQGHLLGTPAPGDLHHPAPVWPLD